MALINNPRQLLKILLIIIIIFLVVVYLKQSRIISWDHFTNTTNTTNTTNHPLINLNPGDIHFIHDDTPSLIEPIILNYKMAGNPGNHNPDNKIKYISVFKHKPTMIGMTTYLPLGSYCVANDLPIQNVAEYTKKIKDKKILGYLASPVITTNQYNLIWTSSFNDDREIISIWRPVCPAGSTSLGDIIITGLDTPTFNTPCIPITMLQPLPVSSGIIWQSMNDSGADCYCWGAGNMEGFRATHKYGKDITVMPELENVYNVPLQYLTANTVSTPAENLNGIAI